MLTLVKITTYLTNYCPVFQKNSISEGNKLEINNFGKSVIVDFRQVIHYKFCWLKRQWSIVKRNSNFLSIRRGGLGLWRERQTGKGEKHKRHENQRSEWRRSHDCTNFQKRFQMGGGTRVRLFIGKRLGSSWNRKRVVQ